MWRNALGARNLSEGLVTAALWGSALLGLLISLVGLYGPRELLLRGSNSFTDWVLGLGARYHLGDVLGGGDVGSGVFLLNLALAGISQVSGVDVGFLQLWSLCYFYALPSCAVAAAHILAPSCRPGVLDVGITFHSTPTLLLEAAASLPAVAYMTFWLGARIGNSRVRAVGYLYVLLIGAPVFRSVLLQDSVALLKFRHFVEQQLRLPLLLPRILDLYSYFFSHWINAARVSPADKTQSRSRRRRRLPAGVRSLMGVWGRQIP